MIRLFVALGLPDSARRALCGLGNGVPGAKWVRPENLHITLRFVGNIDENIADDVAMALEGIDAGSAEIAFDGLSWFGTRSRPSAIVAKVRKTDCLLHLQRKIESAVVRAGLPPEDRKFMPHVTLARVKGTGVDAANAYCAQHAGASFPGFDATEFTLYSSFLSQSGAIYTPEVEYPLREYAY